MTGHVIIGSHDITNLVIENTYKMDSIETYEAWMDGNKLQHRSGIVSKISGSFDVVLSPQSGVTLAEFAQIMSSATTNGVTYAAVYVTNKGAVEAIDCFYELTNKEHIITANGDFIDVITVELTER